MTATVSKIKQKVKPIHFAILLFVGLLFLTWIIGEPRNAYTEESQHSYYAAAAVRGHVPLKIATIIPSPKWAVDVPSWLYNIFQVGIIRNNGSGTTATTTVLAHLPPFYYFVVGLPTLFRIGLVNLFFMRGLSALMCVLYVSYSFWGIYRYKKGLLSVAGIFLALTPEAYFLGATVNPNGPEISGGLCLYVYTGLIITSKREDRISLYKKWAVVAGTLCLLRTLSPLWVLVAGVYLLIGLGLKDSKDILINRELIKWSLFTFLMGSATFIWDIFWGRFPYYMAFYLTSNYHNYNLIGRTFISITRVPLYLSQAYFSLDGLISPLFTSIWIGLILIIILLNLIFSNKKTISIVLTSVIFSIVIPSVAEASQGQHMGLWWYGYYSLPLYTGVPVLSSMLLFDDLIKSKRSLKLLSLLRRHIDLIAKIIISLVIVAELFLYYELLRNFIVGPNGQLNIMFGPIINKINFNWRTYPYGWQDFWLFLNIASLVGLGYLIFTKYPKYQE
jgi:hypothetical protein